VGLLATLVQASRANFHDADPRFETLSPAMRAELRQAVFRPVGFWLEQFSAV
jgi:hypothetical protein